MTPAPEELSRGRSGRVSSRHAAKTGAGSHIVEIRHIGCDLAASKGKLRRWLDRRGIRPAVFEHSAGGPGITFRVHFDLEDDARAFAKTFRGRLSGGPAAEAGARWKTAMPAGDEC